MSIYTYTGVEIVKFYAENINTYYKYSILWNISNKHIKNIFYYEITGKGIGF